MRNFVAAIGTSLWTGAFAIVLTAVTGGVWSALLLANLKLDPAVPWAAGTMTVLSLVLWTFMAGSWGPRKSRPARKALLRARLVPPKSFAMALAAGSACLVALAGLWIVMFQLVKVPGNTSDFSGLPAVTVFASLAMASLVGALFEEGGFRGYFQGTLERYLPGPVAVLLCALVMAPEHAATQGFVWPTMLFYLLVDVMLGFSAYLTKSILPGVVVHAAGLFTFFAFVWPNDRLRAPVWLHGADMWFWLHVAQTAAFGIAGVALFVRLARMAKREGLTLMTSAPGDMQ